MFKRKEFLTIFIIQVTEVLGFSLILPFLPFLAQEYGANPLVIGAIGMTFSFFQFLSAPVLGRLSDVYGRKPLLFISQLSTFISFIVLGFSNSLALIFLSRIIDGLFGSNFTIAQAYLADISSKEERSVAFGISGMAFGFGFLIGPAFGGFLSQYGFALPSFIAATMAFVTLIITQVFLKETVDVADVKKFKFSDVRLIDFSALKKYAFNRGDLSAKIWVNFLYVWAHMIFVSNFSLFGERQYGFNVTTIGYVLTFVGFTSIILRGVVLQKLIQKLGEERLTYIGFLSMGIGLLTAGVFTNPWYYLFSVLFFSFGTGVLRPVLIGEISRSVSQKKQGELFGVTGALGSLSQVTAPIISGFLLNYYFPGTVPFFTVGVILAALGTLIVQNPLFATIYKNYRQ